MVHVVEFFCKVSSEGNIELTGVENGNQRKAVLQLYTGMKRLCLLKIIEAVLKSYLVEDIRIKEPTIEEIAKKYYGE